MSNRKALQAQAHIQSALAMEKEKDYAGAIARYQKATSADPSNPQGWNRLMIAYRKVKTPAEEVKLIKSAISSYQKATETVQQDWIKSNQKKADSTRELAKALGLLQSNGLPIQENDNLTKWQTRLYLLQHRIKAKAQKAKRKK